MFKFLTSRVVVIIIVGVAAVGAAVYLFSPKKPVLQFVAVTRGDISENVIVTGNTKPVQTLDLAFERTGKILRVNADVGARVTAGEVIVELDSGELAGQLRQVEATVRSAQAKLDALKRGTRPEDVQVTRTQLDKARQDLANDYNGVLATLNDAYAKSDDAVRNQLSAMFANAETLTPQLTFLTFDSQTQIDVQSQRVIVGTELNNWKAELAALGAAAQKYPAALDAALKNAQNHLAITLVLLSKTMDAVTSSASLGATTVTTYKTSVTAAKSGVNTAITSVNTSAQTIASQKLVVKQNEDQLALQLAGSTAEDIRAQEALVEEAQANVSVIEAQLTQTIIRSPINGTVTKQDAKVGQITAANKSLVSVISANNLDIEANVPEVDIGKIAVDDNVAVTFDAFPGEIFSGKVAEIDPAETIVDGVVNFKITVALDKSDPRMKSGLTANLSIEAVKKTGILILPQVAIVQNDQGAFVRKEENSGTKDYPVRIGIRDQNGNVEIISGVSEGDEVVNVGVKTQ